MNDNSLDVLTQLGKRIAYLRQEKGMSQLSFSFESGIAKSYLSELESGKRNPTVKVLNRIAIALGVTIEELFRGIVPLEQLL